MVSAKKGGRIWFAAQTSLRLSQERGRTIDQNIDIPISIELNEDILGSIDIEYVWPFLIDIIIDMHALYR